VRDEERIWGRFESESGFYRARNSGYERGEIRESSKFFESESCVPLVLLLLTVDR
jgi:hypothetical protein